ncbi:vitamin K epoxide reductase complex subunit 1-like protein 1 [Vanessa atalanta]|uniref:vitamin K epoxide reductase complex subunit 1-like protein 1 n=1 Tax=Vanessa atalanta TaxID=42275 RepID=UPI001FCD1C70|nr:vitamin K epoxide reductase complex subunit 1-like protein 1 [Vanessa atalanta]XP_047533134.1 vitamin K epoxide reductase complex subunit 1-like protein 1 [Vanessa atalanta]XP_047533135.1 vitamin K epoxide reductase complex subunit 1-like protein 1 [Vanessa atalanta]XP_047533136.1 vitamin K epoxide reductase complex subunit 1-like protein 1 [Vanessa atalanta]XP_047533138.1 vitamin K epoxide reductase complex subunit 1-like protein 1 [Vanessa atalanta]
MQITGLNRAIIAICLLGILISTYALYVEMAAEMKPGYKALCDISEHASCSKVLTSKYGKGLGIMPKDSPFKLPNCVYGVMFYSIMIFLTTFNVTSVVKVQIALSITSLATCVYLAYLLIFVLRDFCVVCVSTYLLNIIIAILLNKKHNGLLTKNR